jgi:serine/threonine-protein kinase
MPDDAPKVTDAKGGPSEPELENVEEVSEVSDLNDAAAVSAVERASQRALAASGAQPKLPSGAPSGPHATATAAASSSMPAAGPSASKVPLPSYTSASPRSGGGTAEDDPLIGTTLLDRVRIERPIARGGMGKVYYGEQVGMKRPCAIKILDPRLAGDGNVAEFARRFLLEASTAAKLTHQNVVTIFDYGETVDGSCFIAMEYLQGRTLSEEMKRNGRLAPERAIHVARQVCRALREAHTLGVVHRDMKPGNVFLLKKDDDDDFVKVLDFGLVKEASTPEGQDHTQIGQIMGSPRYMAPEQVQGKHVDARTDIYSLGAMLYAMLAGRPPFDKATELATMMAQVSDPPPAIATVAPEAVLPMGLEAVVMKCLAKNPDDRFSSMEELITALRLRPGMMTTASDSGSHPAPQNLVRTLSSDPSVAPRKSRAPVVLVVAAVVGLGLSGVLLLRQETPPPVVAPTAAAPPPPVPTLTPTPTPPPAPKPKATLHVETEPAGAKIKEEGDVVCEATPCDIVYSGDQADPTYEHLLTFLKADYKLERKLVKVSASPYSLRLTRSR